MTHIESARPDRAPGLKRNRIAATLAALACATMLSSAPASAGTEVSIVPHGFGAIPLEVISEDGKTWTKIKTDFFPLSVTIGIGRTDESVTSYYIRQKGQPGDYFNNSGHLLKEILNPSQIRVDRDHDFLGFTNYMTAAEKQGILDLCNSQLGVGNGIQQTHNMLSSIGLELIAYFTNHNVPGINVGGYYGQKRPGSANIAVKCVGAPARPGGVVAEQPKDLKVGSIELFRSTYTGTFSQPNPGTQCKKARWLVRMTTNKAGPVKFKLWLKNGDGPMTSKVVDTWSAFDGNGGFKAEYAEWTEVTKTSVVQGMAEDMTNPIGQSSGWKQITLQCNGVGGGGLANPGGMLPPTVTGDLTLADAGPKDQPRQGQAVFKIWSSKSGNTTYKLTCSGGREWTGSLPTHKVGDEKYQAVGAHNFNVDKTEQIGCVVRSTSVPGDPVIAIATKLFEVIKRNPDVAGPGGVTIPPRPTHDSAPQRLVETGTKTAPQARPPKLVCIGGKSTGTACFCPGRTVKVQTGPNRFVCQMGAVTTGAQPGQPARRLIGPNARPLGVVAPNGAVRPTVRPATRESAIGGRRLMR